MESKYSPHVARNVFSALTSDESLRVLGLSLAANDLMSNLNAMGTLPEDETTYFFYNSIAIVREVAKLVVSTETSTLSERFSDETWTSFKELEAVLAPYHDASLARSVLKPIRDVTFHYDLTKSKEATHWNAILEETRRQEQLDVGISSDDRSLHGQRYTFADRLRTEYVNRFLTTEIVSQLSSVSVSIGVFVDFLLTDLVHEQEHG